MSEKAIEKLLEEIIKNEKSKYYPETVTAHLAEQALVLLKQPEPKQEVIDYGKSHCGRRYLEIQDVEHQPKEVPEPTGEGAERKADVIRVKLTERDIQSWSTSFTFSSDYCKAYSAEILAQQICTLSQGFDPVGLKFVVCREKDYDQLQAQLKDRTKDEIKALIEKYGDPQYKTSEFALYDVIGVAQQLQAEVELSDKLCPIGLTNTCGYWAKQQKEIEGLVNLRKYIIDIFRQHAENKWHWDDEDVLGVVRRCVMSDEDFEALRRRVSAFGLISLIP